jgi:ferredoxin-NADP reductase
VTDVRDPRVARASTVDARLLLSARSPRDILYRSELQQLAAGEGVHIHYTFTRLDAQILTDVGLPAAQRPQIFVSGPTGFVRRVADLLVALGHNPARVEDFGPAGE